jgi:HK97 family phage portal protein
VNFIKAIKDRLAKPWQWVGGTGYQYYSTNYDAWIKEAYNNPFIFAAIQEIITDFNAAKVAVYKQKRNGDYEEQKNHKVLTWLENPNIELSQSQFQQYFITWLLLNGGVLLKKSKGVIKKDLFIYAPNTFEIKRDDITLQIDSIKIGNTTVPYNEMKNYKIVKSFNVEDNIAGYSTEFQSPMRALAKVGDLTNYALNHQAAQLKNSGRRNGMLSYRGFKSDKQKQEAEQKLRSMTTGENTGKFAMIPGDQYEFIDMSQNAQELDWLNSIKYMQEVIASCLGVPIQLISSTGTTYNNVAEFKKKIYNDTIIPLLKEYCNQMTAFLQEDLEGCFIWYDVSEIQELQPDVMSTVKSLSEALAGKVTLNTFYRLLAEKTGLKIDKLPKELGDKVLTNQSQIFLDDLNFTPEPPSGEEGEE